MYPPLNDGYIRTNVVIVVRHSGDLVPAFETGGKEVERENRVFEIVRINSTSN